MILCVLLPIACSSPVIIEEEPTLTKYGNVDARLIPYFEAFERAARSQNKLIKLNNWDITAEIKPIQEKHVAGLCQYRSRGNDRHIIIDQDFWNRSSINYREYIIFHELGHCILKRDHHEGCRTDGTYLSLMRSGHGSCRDRYNEVTKPYYIAELFGNLNK